MILRILYHAEDVYGIILIMFMVSCSECLSFDNEDIYDTMLRIDLFQLPT
jgi:hypothetical protein